MAALGATTLALTASAIGVVLLANPSAPEPVPGRDATLASVARTYLEAAKHHDCGLTRALTTAHTWAWCDDPRLLSYTERVVPPDDTESDNPCLDYTIDTTGTASGSLPRGEEPWVLCFVQTPDGWRLRDQGQD
ncbi:hypothetical protein ACFVU2_00330 [Leifsonia sp. NPDC058194]|uniref:hypothetical protein n=1 Tax=Leifsonia sp. NPDC058194 TaxID=3346374 RepID=UPI0036DD88DA